MAAFRFSLQRALTWRETQLTLEETRLERLHADLRALQQAAEAVREEWQTAQTAVRQAPSVSGAAVAELDMFRLWARREEERLAARTQETQKAIDTQQCVVSEARRKVRLLERLREHRHAGWKAEEDRQIEELAGESAIAQWRRSAVACSE
jgi:hypothetical protein